MNGIDEQGGIAEDRQLVERVFYLAENLLQQVPEFTGVIGPGGEKEDDYIRDSIGQELVAAKARLAARLDDAEERDTLRKALERYGRHDEDCDTYNPGSLGPWTCTCGLETRLSAAAAPREASEE